MTQIVHAHVPDIKPNPAWPTHLDYCPASMLPTCASRAEFYQNERSRLDDLKQLTNYDIDAVLIRSFAAAKRELFIRDRLDDERAVENVLELMNRHGKSVEPCHAAFARFRQDFDWAVRRADTIAGGIDRDFGRRHVISRLENHNQHEVHGTPLLSGLTG